MEHVSGRSERDLAGGGQRRSLRRALEQQDVELALERVDLAREGGLRDTEAPRRGDERRLLGDGDEVPKVPQLHARPLAGGGRRQCSPRLKGPRGQA